MSTDLTVTSGTAPTSPTPPLPTSRALVPVAPVVSRPEAPPSGSPLGRSGLDLLDVLAEPDTLVTREPARRVALDAGLEQARGALVRNFPADALASLDRVWDSARHTEEGWYLRGGSLTLLGLPGEADRVVDGATASQPNSPALRFLQSVARLALGDLAGARAALGTALLQRPSDPLLLVQQALVVAHQGDRLTAQAMMSRAATVAPEHPAIAYGRAALRMVFADASRVMTTGKWSQSGAHVVFSERESSAPANLASRPDRSSDRSGERAVDRSAGSSNDRSDVRSGARSDLRSEIRSDLRSEIRSDVRATGTNRAWPIEGEAPATAVSDVAMDAIKRIGVRLATIPARDAAAEARTLLRAFSAGGTLVATVNAERAHAARTVLAACADALAESDSSAAPRSPSSAISRVVRELVSALREGRGDIAAQVAQRASTMVSEPLSVCLRVLVSGTRAELAPSEAPALFLRGAEPDGESLPSGTVTSDSPNAPVTGDGRRTQATAPSTLAAPSPSSSALAAPAPSSSASPASAPSPSPSPLTLPSETVVPTHVPAQMPVRGGEHERTPLVPLRLGLALLSDERAQALAFATAHYPVSAFPSEPSVTARLSPDYEQFPHDPAALPYDAHNAPAWGAGVVGVLTSKSAVGGAQNARFVAIAFVAVAFAAFAVGYPILGMALAGGAAWLALRRGGGTADHDRYVTTSDRDVPVQPEARGMVPARTPDNLTGR